MVRAGAKFVKDIQILLLFFVINHVVIQWKI